MRLVAVVVMVKWVLIKQHTHTYMELPDETV